MRSQKGEQTLKKPEQNWHAKHVGEVLRALGSNREGLMEADVAERRARYGQNAFSQQQATTFLMRLLGQFKSPLTLILLLASVITLALGEYIDTTVIIFALSIAVVVGIVQEGRASRAFEQLAKSQAHTATVVRGGKRHEIPAEDVVPGDVVILQSGMQVPADLRLLEAKKLSVNEAALTGEWLAADKDVAPVDVGVPLAERAGMAWKGTFVADGRGMGVVVATGDHTEVGKLASELSTIEDEVTPLQWQMRHISHVMFYIILALVVVIFALGLVRGESIEAMLITSIAIAVASIPEGLPAAVTIVLAISMESLLTRGGLVRNLLAAETLGSTTFVLTDKTGTLTEGRMALTKCVYLHSEESAVHESGSFRDDTEACGMLDIALCGSDAFVEQQEIREGKDDTFIVRGEPMERAILEAALDAGVATEGTSAHGRRIDYLSFTSENRFAAGLRETEGASYRMCVNGAPEYVLEASTSVSARDGARSMGEEDRQFFSSQIDRFTKHGMRLIGVAYRTVDDDTLPEDPADIMHGLVFMGLLVFHDPIRTDVHEAIEEVARAGAAIRLVTGDNPLTALSVAQSVGIAREHDVALTGKDIVELSDEELYEAIKTSRVFARVLPRQKLRLAQVLQKHGEIVAMTGDGVNDAPALQKANIGVALGSGTEVAKEASDLVLVNDTFATMSAAIEEGRRIISNLRKIVGYLLSTSISEAVLIGAALLIGAPIPIVPVQILWANIIEEGLMSVAFAFEPSDKAAMRERPHDIHEEGILSKEVLSFIGLVVGVLGALLLSLYALLLYLDLDIDKLRSVMFLAVAIDSLFIAFSFRALRVPLWRIPLGTNKFFIGSFVLSLGALGIVLAVPFMQTLLSYEPLSIQYLLLVLSYGFMSLVTIEVGKWFFFEHKS